MNAPPVATAPAIDHYENFPVASWLCPPHLRAPIAAIYHFARTADDLADEGDAAAEQRLRDLAAYRADLDSTEPSARWPHIFGPLRHAIATHALPRPPLHDLLDAFEEDVRRTASGEVYPAHDDLLRYSAKSANPVGRLLLHLYGVADAPSLAQSDAICTALQLINFWQDLSVDLPRQRFYLPQDLCAAHAIDSRTGAGEAKNATNLIANIALQARQRMTQGAPLVHRVPGRAGWELRLVVQGALRVLDKVERLGERVRRERPRLTAWDAPIVLWRALWM